MKLEDMQTALIENHIEAPPVQIEYTYKDGFGQVLGTSKLNSWLLPDTLVFSNYFDGLVETEFGQFLMECTVDEARRVIAKIKKYVEAKKELDRLEASLQDLKEQERRMTKSYQSNPNKYEKELSRIMIETIQLKDIVLPKRFGVKAFEEELRDYRV